MEMCSPTDQKRNAIVVYNPRGAWTSLYLTYLIRYFQKDSGLPVDRFTSGTPMESE